MKYDIYFHNDFDGYAASAVMLAFLRSRGDNIEHFIPLKYDIIPRDGKTKWLDEKFLSNNKLFRGKHNPAIIVDFPFHPETTFWFDHHIRPFRKAGWDKKFKPTRERRFDDSYRSACHLVYDSLRAAPPRGFGWKPPTHLRELVKWLNVIDFADYRSARQTIEMKEPAIQCNTYLEHKEDGAAVSEKIINWLATRPLDEIVQIPEVKKRVAALRRDVAASLRFHKEHLKIDGRVMTIDLTGDKTDDLAYFGPYHIHPKSLYLIRYHPFPHKPSLFHVNVGANPWKRSHNKKNIGELLKSYGGGGHKDVGGVEIVGRTATERAVREITKFLNAK